MSKKRSSNSETDEQNDSEVFLLNEAYKFSEDLRELMKMNYVAQCRQKFAFILEQAEETPERVDLSILPQFVRERVLQSLPELKLDKDGCCDIEQVGEKIFFDAVSRDARVTVADKKRKRVSEKSKPHKKRTLADQRKNSATERSDDDERLCGEKVAVEPRSSGYAKLIVEVPVLKEGQTLEDAEAALSAKEDAPTELVSEPAGPSLVELLDDLKSWSDKADAKKKEVQANLMAIDACTDVDRKLVLERKVEQQLEQIRTYKRSIELLRQEVEEKNGKEKEKK